MKHVISSLALLAGTLGMGHCAAVGEPQHGHPAPAAKAGKEAGKGAAPQLDRADPHVAQIFNILRSARGQGDKVDMDRLQDRLRDVARAHAIEYSLEPAASEEMIMLTAHNAWFAAQSHPENLNSLDAFNKSIGAK